VDDTRTGNSQSALYFNHKHALFSQKRDLLNPKRAFSSPKRALFSQKRALVNPKRAFSSQKRALFSRKRAS